MAIDYDAIEADIERVKKLFKPFIRTKDEDKKHSLYSPSSMDRIMGCPGHINLIKKFKIVSQDSIHSIKGTHTHTLMEFIFKHGAKLLRHIGSKDFKAHLNYTIEMEQAANTAVKFALDEKAKMGDAELLIEEKVKLQEIVKDDCGGTSDIVLYKIFGILHIMDYKNGTSKVEPEENKQLMTYGLGVLHKLGWDFKEVWITIIQPNAPHKLGPIRTWKTTIKRFERFENELIAAVKATKKPDAPLVMSDKYCYFCPVNQANKCPLKNEVTTGKLMKRFERNESDGKEEIKTQSKSKNQKSAWEKF